MSRKGSFAILAGPDGSGKTTISRALVRRAEDAGLTVTTAHYRPGLIGGRVQGSKITSTPHQQRRRGMLAGVLKLGLLTADMTLGHFFLWRPPRRRGLLIVERGWWDMAVDPARYRLDPRLTGLIKMVGHLIPKADTVVLLAGDATAIDSRKTEIGAEEVGRQVTRWQQLAPLAGTGTLTIDSVRSSPDMAAEAIFSTMLSSMAEDQLRLRRVPLTPRRLNLQCAGRSRPAARLYAPFHPIRRVLYPFTFAIARHALVPPSSPPFDIQALCRHLDLDCEGFVLMHSSHSARWIVGVCERGALSTVIKIGEHGDAPLANEELTLRALHHASARTVAVPHLRWSGHWQDHLVVATDALPSTRRRITMADAVKLCNSMVSGGGGMPPVVHGDFAPWNVSVQRSQPVVLDWECARFGRAPMFDLAHFVIMSAALLGRGSPEKAVWQLCAEKSAGARHLEAVGEDPSSARQFVRQYLASTPASGHQVAVFRARVEELLCKKVEVTTGSALAAASRELLLRQIFAEPAERYFIVLRNDETLPAGLTGTDLDVCVRPGRTPGEVVDYLVTSGGKLGWFPVSVSERPHMCGFTLVRPNTAEVEAIHFDVFNGITYLGMSLCSPLVLDRESSVRDGVRVLSDRGKALATLVHHLAWNGYLSKEKYRAGLAEVLANPADAAWIRQHAAAAFGRRAARELLASSSLERFAHKTISSRVMLSAAILRKAAEGSPGRPARQIMRYWAGQWSSFRSPPGIVGRAGDHFPERPDLRLTEELACGIAPHGCAAPSARTRATKVHTLNGPRYERTTSAAWKRWTPVRWLAPSFFLLYQAKRNRVVVLSGQLPIGLRILRHLRAPSWIGAPSESATR